MGLVTEVLRKALRAHAGYLRFAQSGRAGKTVDFAVDAVLLPSPYASSFGGFVNLPAAAWMAAGGVAASLTEGFGARRPTRSMPEDMSTTSLIGGGMIAGDALAALAIGMAGLLAVTRG